MVGCRLPDLSAHLDPVRVACCQRAVHWRRGQDGVPGAVGSRAGGRVWQAYLLSTPERWETAILLMVVNVVDLFGGYAFNIALSRRIFDVTPPLSP